MRWTFVSLIWLVGIFSLVSARSKSVFVDREKRRLHCNQCSFVNATLVRHVLRRHMLPEIWDMFAKSMGNLFQKSLTVDNAGQVISYMNEKTLREQLNSDCASNYSQHLMPCQSDEYQYCRWAVWKWNGQTLQASYTCETESDAYWRTCAYAHGEPLLGEICAKSCFTDGCNSGSSMTRSSVTQTGVLSLSILAVINGLVRWLMWCQ